MERAEKFTEGKSLEEFLIASRSLMDIIMVEVKEELYGMALVASVIYLSLAAELPPYLHIAPDLKLGHMLAYAVLMLYFAQLIADSRMGWLIAGLFVAMGIVLEYLQGMTGYRTFALYDMFANFLGVSVGFILSKTGLVNTVERLDKKIDACL